MTFCTEVHDSQTMDLTEFCDSLTFYYSTIIMFPFLVLSEKFKQQLLKFH